MAQGIAVQALRECVCDGVRGAGVLQFGVSAGGGAGGSGVYESAVREEVRVDEGADKIEVGGQGEVPVL